MPFFINFCVWLSKNFQNVIFQPEGTSQNLSKRIRNHLKSNFYMVQKWIFWLELLIFIRLGLKLWSYVFAETLSTSSRVLYNNNRPKSSVARIHCIFLLVILENCERVDHMWTTSNTGNLWVDVFGDKIFVRSKLHKPSSFYYKPLKTNLSFSQWLWSIPIELSVSQFNTWWF